MICRRCQGLLVRELLGEGLLVTLSYRCVNCGAMLDQQIEANRRATQPPSRKGTVHAHHGLRARGGAWRPVGVKGPA